MNPATGPSGPERFFDKRPAYVRRNFYLLCACLTILVFLAAGLVYSLFLEIQAPPTPETKGIHGEQRRDLAGKLLSAGLKDKAIEQYGLYLSETDLPADRRARVAYTLGELSMEGGNYEDALGWLYQVEMLDPKTELAPEVGSKIVACLERIGRSAQAQYSLEARSGLGKNRSGELRGDQVVAQIGNDVITLSQLDEAIESMPEWIRSSVEEPGQKQAFLEQYVAEELLHQKAKRLGMDKDPSVRRQSERALRQLMIQKVLEEEIKAKVKISPEDVELYFQAHQDRYMEKEAFKIRMIKIDEDRLEGLRKALEGGEDFSDLAREHSMDQATRERGGEVSEWIEEGLDPTGLGDPAGLWEALENREEGEVSEPIRGNDGYYIFQIASHLSPRTQNLEEARRQVETDLYRERVEKAYQQLVQQALRASEVKLFPERLRQAEGGDDRQGTSKDGT